MRLCVAFVIIVALMGAALMPLDIALGQEANPARVLPDTVQRGGTFDVTVTFTTPADEFNSIALRDTAPDGWNVTVDAAWCSPNAEYVKATGNQASLIWYGPYDKGVDFTVVYKVTVPCDASPGSHSFNVSPYEIFLSYYIGNGSKILENIMGNYELEVGLTAIAAICHSPESLSSTQGGSNPENMTLEIWNSGCGMLNWLVSDDAVWLSENPTSGSSTGADDTTLVTVWVNTTGMSAGDYSANITITAPGVSNSPQIVPVSLHVISAVPEISFKPESLAFTAVGGGPTPADETLEVWNSGIDTINWMLSDDAAWLSENSTSGSSTGEHDTVAVSVDTTGMSAGDYSANITITAPGVNNSPQTVPVSLHVGEISPSPQAWLSQYWWTIVAGIVVVVLLVYFLRRRRGA